MCIAPERDRAFDLLQRVIDERTEMYERTGSFDEIAGPDTFVHGRRNAGKTYLVDFDTLSMFTEELFRGHDDNARIDFTPVVPGADRKDIALVVDRGAMVGVMLAMALASTALFVIGATQAWHQLVLLSAFFSMVGFGLGALHLRSVIIDLEIGDSA